MGRRCGCSIQSRSSCEFLDSYRWFKSRKFAGMTVTPTAHDFSWSFSLVLSFLACTNVAAEIADPQLLRISDAFNDESVLLYYANCLLDKGPCPSDGRAIKGLLPDFIATNCARCSERNKRFACQVINTMQQSKYTNLWSEFRAKYDPYRQYEGNLETFLQTCRLNSYI